MGERDIGLGQPEADFARQFESFQTWLRNNPPSKEDYEAAPAIWKIVHSLTIKDIMGVHDILQSPPHDEASDLRG